MSTLNGQISQHVEYIAFGEVLFEEHSSSFKSPYLFNGKELDRETNLTNFGARYLDMKTSLWLSVDPLVEKYPAYSPYAYCINNPLNVIDPDGRDIIFAKDATDEFKANFAKSIAYLKANKVDGIFAKLQASDVVYVIEEGNKNTAFDPSTNTITWDDNNGLKTTEGEFLSPTTLLNHEADHALQEESHPVKKFIDKLLPSKYSNKEEERVIKGSEQRTAKALGEITKEDGVTREDHKGTYVKTKEATSNVPEKPKEKPKQKQDE
ncbi:RHS repeat-associated core domain-containing protein [Flavobacterium psychrophilum]|nr:RHS repeat-associated core domain-containing protein [Flavobacterium psychrophilum]